VKIRMFQVDAFADRVFAGNPAAVCPLEAWPEDGLLQAIAAENNLSETAFLVPDGEDFELRWFTPEAEVDLCGHATLASAHVVLGYMQPSRESVRFHTRERGDLVVRRGEEGRLVMDFPALPPGPVEDAAEREAVTAALGAPEAEVLAALDYVVVLGSEEEVRGLEPDMRDVSRLERRGVAVTARGADSFDFMSRFFAPKVGVPEDPVTGSAHCELAPLWAERLGRTELRAGQLSRRGGEVACEVAGDRVRLGGRAVLYLEGSIRVPEGAGTWGG